MYLARSNRVPARRLLPRTLLAPARRLARTTISLGPEAGIIFGLRALRQAHEVVDGGVHLLHVSGLNGTAGCAPPSALVCRRA